MKTNEQNNNFQELDRRVEQLLSPRFAPSADEIKLSKPKRPARRIWLSAMHIGGVAAAIVMGIFLIGGPINKVEAKAPEEIVTEALATLQNADSYRISFTAKVSPAPVNDNDYYRLDPNGNEIKGVMTLLKTASNTIMRIEWESGVTQLYDSERYYEWEGTKQVENKEQKINHFKLLALADLETVKDIMGGEIEFKEDANGKNILAIADSPDYAREKVRVEGIFSKKSGKLIGGNSYQKINDEWITLVKVSKIDYGFPLTVEEITASPKR